jgi:hypothetical protein
MNDPTVFGTNVTLSAQEISEFVSVFALTWVITWKESRFYADQHDSRD